MSLGSCAWDVYRIASSGAASGIKDLAIRLTVLKGDLAVSRDVATGTWDIDCRRLNVYLLLVQLPVWRPPAGRLL
jgi:hypothetical protein